MVIKRLHGDFVHNFPRFASSKLTLNGKEVEILISSTSFTQPNFEKTEIVAAPAKIKEVNLDKSDLVEVDQIISLGNILGG
jgi:hypothetical protein